MTVKNAVERTNIVLIGLMGCGKTAVGQALSELTGAEMVDTDDLVELKAGMTISQIFDSRGEEFFRDIETEVLSDLQSRSFEKGVVVASGGGMPLRSANRCLMRSVGTVVWLRASVPTLAARLRNQAAARPLIAADVEHIEDRLGQLLSERSHIYTEAAHIIVDVESYPTALSCARAVLDQSISWSRQ